MAIYDMVSCALMGYASSTTSNICKQEILTTTKTHPRINQYLQSTPYHTKKPPKRHMHLFHLPHPTIQDPTRSPLGSYFLSFSNLASTIKQPYDFLFRIENHANDEMRNVSVSYDQRVRLGHSCIIYDLTIHEMECKHVCFFVSSHR
jgi:hypothetical protein